MDSCKIQVTKERAKGSIDLIESSPTQMPGSAETCRSSRLLCFICPSFAFLRYPVTMFFKQCPSHRY